MRALLVLLLLLPHWTQAQNTWRWAVEGITCPIGPFFQYSGFLYNEYRQIRSPYDFQFDKDGNLYICGYYNIWAPQWDGIFRLGNKSVKRYTAPANAQYSFYIAKIDPGTGNPIWIQSIRTEGMALNSPIRMKVRPDGRKIYLSMPTEKTIYIDDNLIDTKTPNASLPQMIVALNVDGFTPAFSKVVLLGGSFENMVIGEADNSFLVKDGNDDAFQDYTQYMLNGASDEIVYQKPLKGFYESEKIVYYDAATGHYVSNWLSRFDATLKLVSSINSVNHNHLSNYTNSIGRSWTGMNRFWIDKEGNQYLLYGRYLETDEDFYSNRLIKLSKTHQVLWNTPLFSAPYKWSNTLVAPDANGNPWIYMQGSSIGDIKTNKDTIPSGDYWAIQEIDPATGKAGKRRLAPTDMLQGGLEALGFAISKENQFYVGGSYRLLAQFGNTILTNTCSNNYHTLLYYLASSGLPPQGGRMAKNMLAYPNPTEGKIVVDEDLIQADLYHHSGLWMGSLSILESREMDLSAYPSGLYYLRLQSEDGIQQIKIIKQ